MIKIRLRRQGAKHRPSYRIVAMHDRSPRGGKVIEELGFYDPLTDPATVRMDTERARYWLSVGAKPSSATVVHLLQRHEILSEDGRLIPVQGTLTDPLTRTIAELIRHTDHGRELSTTRIIEFSGRLADYLRTLSASYPDPPSNSESLDKELRDWIHHFVAQEFPAPAIEKAEAEMVLAGIQAAD